MSFSPQLVYFLDRLSGFSTNITDIVEKVRRCAHATRFLRVHVAVVVEAKLYLDAAARVVGVDGVAGPNDGVVALEGRERLGDGRCGR